MNSNTTVTLNRSSFDRHFHGGPAVQIYAVHVRVHENDWPQVDTVIRCRGDEFADRLAEFVAAHSVLAAAAEAIEITPQDELSATVAAYDPRWGLSTVADCSFRVELASTAERAAEQAARSAAAAALGRRGGASTSPAKRAASRANGARGGRPRALAADLRAFERRCERVGRLLARDTLAARRHAASLSPTLPPIPRRFPLDRAAVAERLAAGAPVRDFWDAPRLRELDDTGRRRVLDAAGRPDYLSRVLAAARAAWAARCGR